VRADGRCNFSLNVNSSARSTLANKSGCNASLSRCPLHPHGGCGFARHGTYERRSPPGTLIARWYCRQGHRTFCLLPDCLAARLPGTLAELEAVVVGVVEQDLSLEAACAQLRLEVGLPGVLRWVRRRVQCVHAALHPLKGILPELFEGCFILNMVYHSKTHVSPCRLESDDSNQIRTFPDFLLCSLSEIPSR
jgi:hypothetical protein